MDGWMVNVSYATWLFRVTGLTICEGSQRERERTSDI